MSKTSSFDRVELVLTGANGERIEVAASINDLLYIDIEHDERCTLNYAENWANLTDERRRKATNFIKDVSNSLECLGIA